MKRVAAALGYIGLVNYNRVNIVAMAERDRRRDRPDCADGDASPQMIDFVSKLQADRPIALGRRLQAVRAGAPSEGRAASSCPISSIKDGYENGLRYVAGGKYDLFCVQVPQPAGDRAGSAGRPEAPRHRRRRHGRGQRSPSR